MKKSKNTSLTSSLTSFNLIAMIPLAALVILVAVLVKDSNFEMTESGIKASHG